MTVYIDENLAQGDDGVVTCRHCTTTVGTAAEPLGNALVRESDPRTAGPSVREDADHFADRPITFRRVFCPECLTLLQSEIVPADEAPARTRSIRMVTA